MSVKNQRHDRIVTESLLAQGWAAQGKRMPLQKGGRTVKKSMQRACRAPESSAPWHGFDSEPGTFLTGKADGRCQTIFRP